MIRYYLNEEPIIPIVETHLLRDPEVCEFVLRNLDRYVIKPTGASGGYGGCDRSEGHGAGTGRDPDAVSNAIRPPSSSPSR